MSPESVMNSQATPISPKPEAKAAPAAGVRLLLLCHAEGMQDRYANLPVMNTGLTAAGWEQAEKLALWLRIHEPIDALFCGSLLQSRLTAQRVGQALGLAATVYRDLPALTRPAGAQCEQDDEAGRRLSQIGRQAAAAEQEDGPRATLIQAIDNLLAQIWPHLCTGDQRRQHFCAAALCAWLEVRGSEDCPYKYLGVELRRWPVAGRVCQPARAFAVALAQADGS